MKLSLFNHKNAEALNASTAEQMLANVFAACGQEPNSVPLEALSSYSNYRKERYAIQRTVIIVVLALFLLLPVLFMPAQLSVEHTNPGTNENPVYRVAVSSRIPIRLIEAEISGRNTPLYAASDNEYTLHPRSNGEMQVCVTLANRQKTTVSLNVDDVDVQAPELISTAVEGDYVCFYLSDEGSGIDYESITVTHQDGWVSGAVRYDVWTGGVYFAYPDYPVKVMIPDMRGNALQVNLKPEASEG